MEFIYITNDPKLAEDAQNSGVDRIMIDLESLGKKKRQGHLDTVISSHSLQDINIVRKIIHDSMLQVRINPIHSGSEKEINEVLSRGADIIMLPMFKTPFEVEKFISYLDGRATSNLLLETPPAVVRIDEILSIPGIDEIHIGLNDLHLGMDLNFMFELLSGGLVDYLVEKIKRAGVKFGFGGVARLGQGKLDSSLILSEHFRLDSKMVILSRDFHGDSKTYTEVKSYINLEIEVKRLRDYILNLSLVSNSQLHYNRVKLKEQVNKIVCYD